MFKYGKEQALAFDPYMLLFRTSRISEIGRRKAGKTV